MKADLPALNSPTTTSRKSAVSCSFASLIWWRSSSVAGIVIQQHAEAGQNRQLFIDQLMLPVGEHDARLLGRAGSASSATKEISHRRCPQRAGSSRCVRWKWIGTQQRKRIRRERISWRQFPLVEVCLRKGTNAIGDLSQIDVTRGESRWERTVPLDADHHSSLTD